MRNYRVASPETQLPRSAPRQRLHRIGRDAGGLRASAGGGRPGPRHGRLPARGGKTIYITSVPYTVNKATLVERIAEVALSRHPPLVDIKDVSTDDVRIALELKKDADERMVMAYLQAHTAPDQLRPSRATKARSSTPPRTSSSTRTTSSCRATGG